MELFHQGPQVASYRRSCGRSGYTTLTQHMPDSHRAHAEWTPQPLVRRVDRKWKVLATKGPFVTPQREDHADSAPMLRERTVLYCPVVLATVS